MTALILYGHQSCGKSYFGKLLAQHLNFLHLDTDQLLETYYHQLHLKKLSCKEIGMQLGESLFRALERTVVLALVQHSNCILSVGGGTLLDEECYEKLKSFGKLIYLELELNDFIQRQKNKTLPFSDVLPKEKQLTALYQQRHKIYQTLSENRLIVTNKSDDALLKELKKFLP